jgi:tetratricopeptide (TPR) repeat protein/TolB-like protein
MPLKRSLLALSASLLLALPAAAATRVLVLPFDTPADAPTVASLGPGTMDSLITALTQVPDFVLVDRATLGHLLKEQALQQSGLVDDKTAVRLGKLLGVQAIIHGRVQVAGDRVRLSASFIEAETGRVRRAEQVTGRLDDVFDLQDQLAHQFVADQGVTITPKADKQMVTMLRSTSNIKAYEAYQQGQNWCQFATPGGYENALAWYDQALQVDPAYTLAWAGKASAIAALVWMHAGYYHTTTVTYEEGLAAARRALDLQPDLPQAQRAMALILCSKNDYANALVHARRALEQSPNDPESWTTNWFANNSRNPDDPSLLRALELNPRLVLAHIQRSIMFAWKGRFAEATASAETVLKLSPQSDSSHFLMGMLLFAKGHPIKAVEAFQKAVELNPKHAAAFNYMGDALRSLSRYDDAMTAYRNAIRLRPDYYDARESLLRLERQER